MQHLGSVNKKQIWKEVYLIEKDFVEVSLWAYSVEKAGGIRAYSSIEGFIYYDCDEVTIKSLYEKKLLTGNF